MRIKSVVIVCLVAMLPFAVAGQTIKPGRIWKDTVAFISMPMVVVL